MTGTVDHIIFVFLENHSCAVLPFIVVLSWKGYFFLCISHVVMALRYTPEQQEALVSNVFLTGGNMHYPGMKERVERELLAMRPFQSHFKVWQWHDFHPDVQCAVSPRFISASTTVVLISVSMMELYNAGAKYFWQTFFFFFNLVAASHILSHPRC